MKKVIKYTLMGFGAFMLLGICIAVFSPKSASISAAPKKADTTIAVTEKTSAPKVDEGKIKELEKSVIKTKDEFNGYKWVSYKRKPKFRNENGIYCEFVEDSTGVSNFRFVVQYAAADWLFIKSYDFAVDGQPFRDWKPTKVERDNNEDGIWEWSDDAIDNKYTEAFIKGLAEAHTAKIRFNGDQYAKDKDITKDQLAGIKTIYDLYKAMGGTF